MPYCLYLRKSRQDREAEALGAGETLSRHRSILLESAAKAGITIDGEYKEIVSGETISARPEMKRLLSDVMLGKWDGVYVMEVERLARGDTQDQGIVANTFKYTHTKILTPQRVYDPANAADEEYFEFGLFMSRREYKTINRRQQLGRIRSVAEGKYISYKPAFGYCRKKLASSKGWTLEIVPSEAEIVRHVFAWYADGMGLAAICRKLNLAEDQFAWKPKRIAAMLENEIYIGKIRWGRNPVKKEMINGEIVSRRILSNEYQVVDGLHPPIISADLWQAAQQARKGRKKIPLKVDHTLANPLAGLLICKECHLHMIMKPPHGKQPASVHCHTPGCPNVSSYLQFVESSVLSTLKGWLDAYRLPDRFVSKPQNTDADRRMAALRQDQQRLRKQLTKCQILLETDVYSVDEYRARTAAIKSELSKTESAVQALRAKDDEQPQYLSIDEMAPIISTLLELYDSLDASRKNALLRQIISKIEYKKEKKGGRYLQPDKFVLDVFPAYKA